ncbi:hypothetical protein TNCV_2431781 [Trichonephila clavipes]|nr:hypothetical protein TNCV_2431781 [Trichonephila clavipes]
MGIGPTPETERWKFINPHGHVDRFESGESRQTLPFGSQKSRSGFLNRPLEIFSHKTSSPEFVHVLGLRMARFKLSNSVFFFGTNCLCKTRQTLVMCWVPDK